MAGDAHLSRVGMHQGREDLHRRGLAGAVRPEQREDRTGVDVQIDAVQRDGLAVGLPQAGSLHRRRIEGVRDGHETVPAFLARGLAHRGATDRDVAVGGAGVDLHRVLPRFRCSGGLEFVQDVAEARVEVEPRGDAVADPDLHRSGGGLSDGGAARHVPEPNVPVRGLRGDSFVGDVDRDVAVGRAHTCLSPDLADPRVPVRVLDGGGPVDPADPHGARARHDLRSAGGPFDPDVPEAGLELQGSGLVERDVADAGLAPELAEATARPERRDAGLSVDEGSSWEGDRHFDRLAASTRPPLPPALGTGHREVAVRVLHACLLGGGDVARLLRIARAHVDRRVGSVGRVDPDVADAHLHADGDRFGSIESRHGRSSSVASAPSRCSAERRGGSFVRDDGCPRRVPVKRPRSERARS